MPTPNLATRNGVSTPAPRPATPQTLPEPTETELISWPQSATLTPWIIPLGTDRTLPWKQATSHISELISGDEIVILIGFRDAMDWVGIKARMTEAEQLGVPSMMIASGSEPNRLGAMLYGAGNHAALHGRTYHDGERAIFSPSQDLMRILDIDAGAYTRNCAILFHHGKVIASWVAMDRRGTHPHDWTGIRRALELLDDEPTEIIEELDT